MRTATRSADRPRLIGDGPPTCSTCTDLVPVPQVRWDTNRYYRDLGVSTTATKKEIRQAYLAGSPTVRKTFVVKQLLNPVVRRAYDLTPLGSVFLDEYVARSITRAAVLSTPGGTPQDPAQHDTPSEVVLDTQPGEEQGGSCATEWPWAFYLWGTERQDKKMLAQWQALLVQEFASEQEVVSLAVGLRGGMAPPVEATVVGRRIVVFLHEDEDPTDALASAGRLRYLSHTTHTTRDEGHYGRELPQGR